MWFFNIDRHRRWREKLSASIDERLDPSERQEFEQHLTECSSCQEELQSLRATVALLRQMPQVPVPRSFRLTEVPLPRTLPWTVRYVAPLRYATAAAAVLFLAIALGDVLLPSNGVIEPALAPAERQASTPSPAPITAPALPAPAFAPDAPEPTAVPAPGAAVTQEMEASSALSADAKEEASPEATVAAEEVPTELQEQDRSVLSRTLDWLVVATGALFVGMAILVFLQWQATRRADPKR